MIQRKETIKSVRIWLVQLIAYLATRKMCRLNERTEYARNAQRTYDVTFAMISSTLLSLLCLGLKQPNHTHTRMRCFSALLTHRANDTLFHLMGPAGAGPCFAPASSSSNALLNLLHHPTPPFFHHHRTDYNI